jgi:hypothetical protein
MHARKYFTPSDGLQIPDPATGKPVPEAGQWVDASSYWYRRVSEGSGELTDEAPEAPAPAEPGPGPYTADR